LRWQEKVLGTYMLTFDDMHYNNLLAPANIPAWTVLASDDVHFPSFLGLSHLC